MMSPTKERELVLDFFDYVASGVKLAVKTGNPHNIQMADMSVCGHSIAVNTGSAQDIRNVPLLSQKCVDAGRAPLTNARFPDFQTASLAVVSGRADAIMFDGPVIDYVARTTGQIEAVGQVDSKPLAIGVLKGSPMFPLLREAFIDLMQKGIYQKIMIKWGLGSNIVASPIINDPEG
jgi:polar amino acid transport system substrate-binding protein